MESVMKRFGLFTKLGLFSRESEQEIKVDCGELLEEIHGVERQMVYNEVWFSAECDENLIESCVYQRQALLARYRYLLGMAKKLGVTAQPFQK